ncbi:MAG TPA: Rne/Rng family ribonuclease, partial [Deltaproteobacteria bacterium]|nr:Rne/Rng family ribonuclease [Deltaproteobacteria bacterium]
DDDDDDDQDAETTHIPVGPDRAMRRKARVENVLRSGQEIVVQVRKEALGKKGPRLTTDLSIPGRFLVYVPYGLHVGVSRRITSEEERERLRSLIEEHRQPGEGFIIRTACEGRQEDVLAADVAYLRELWREIRGRIEGSTAPRLLHEELDLVLRATRDLVSTQVDRVIVDDPRDHQRVSDFMKTFMPMFEGKLELYTESAPLFEATGIEPQLGRALTRRIPLPSGGYLVLEHTE